VREGQEQDQLHHARRERGAAVLADLMTRAGVSKPAELARRTQLVGVAISDQTVSNLLAAKGTARDATVLKFIAACLHKQQGNPRLASTTVDYWKARYDDAMGRAGDPAAGLVRIGTGELPPTPLVLVDRPDVVVLAAAVEGGQSVVLTQPDGDGVDYVGTDQVVNTRLDQAPAGAGRPSGERSQVLSGLGGVGKSQLAAQYARQMWLDPSLDLLIWTSARSTDSIICDYADAAAQLLGADPSQPEQAARRLMAWLSTTTRSWLIVLDDVQLPKQVQRWWPEPTASGQVIVTTRYRGEGLHRPGRQIVEVGLYREAQARDYLLRRLAGAPHPYGQTPSEDVLDGLADDLGRLPLALAHATAYLLQQDMPIQEYRAQFADYRTRLGTLFPHRDELPEADLATVATTWQISMNLAARLAPAGVVPVVMLLASLLDPDGIPRDTFTTDAVMTFLDRVLGRAVPEREVWSAVQLLHRLSLFTVDRSNPYRAVRVHALVQRATREGPDHTPDMLAAAARVAADALLEVWPQIERDTDLVAALRSNTHALQAVAEPAMLTPNGHDAMPRAGDSLGTAGLVTEAVAYFQRLHITAHTHLGPDHPDTLAVRARLAHWQGEAGDPVGAATAAAELLADHIRVLGPDHPNTLAVRGNLAYCRAVAGDPVGAATAAAELLADHIRVLGPEHPNTLVVRGNLAAWRGETGDPAGAATAYVELLADEVRVLGPDHPETLITRNNVARWRARAGDPASAVAACAALLTDQVRVLGPDHPDTFVTRGNLAAWQGQAGDSVGAATAYAGLLADLVRVLGPDHPSTLAARHNLAGWQGEAGDAAGATAAFAELLADLVRVLGPDHPSTKLAMAVKVYWQQRASPPPPASAARPG
jgi:hypothetical protein